MLVPLKQIIAKAEKQNYAVGAFNTSNLEISLAIIRGAVAAKAPVIIQTSESAIKYSNLETIYNLMKILANTIGKSVPIAIHLDHGKDLAVIRDCIKIGYQSVHIDASEQVFANNLKLSQQVVSLAHPKKVWVQAELGAILGAEGMLKLKSGQIKMRDLMTDPDQAGIFVKKTKIDALAVSVGTIHGSFKGLEKVDQERLKKIRQNTKIPLVLHGGSGLPDQVFKQAIVNGVRIINIDTNLRIKFKDGINQGLKTSQNKIDPRQILTPAVLAMQAEVVRLAKVFGSFHKA